MNMKSNFEKTYYCMPLPLQTVGVNLFELKEWKMKNSKQFSSNLSFLKRTEHWRKLDYDSYRNKRLRAIIRYAYENVPFYHNLYKKEKIDISKVRSEEDLEILPTISKHDLKTEWSTFTPQVKHKFITYQTSGTTGSPLKIKVSPDLVVLDKACAYRRDQWTGYCGELIARFVGDKPVRDCSDRKLFRHSFVLNRLIFPSYCLSFKNMGKIIDILEEKEVRYLQCYPSTAYILAKYLESVDKRLPLKSILYSSEPMYPAQRELIEDRFFSQCYGYYGQVERAVSAAECEERELHLSMIDGIMEVVKDGQRVRPGERGFTVVTSLHNYAMPLIRYELNDYTGFKQDTCECGRSSPLIYPIEARAGDFIISPSGRILTPRIISTHLKGFTNIIESQVVQKTMDSLEIRIVPTNEFSYVDEKRILDAMEKALGNEMAIKIEKVSKIHATRTFKKRFVVSELGGDYIEKALHEFR